MAENDRYTNICELSTINDLCCCDTVPVKNCGPTCCIQLQCEQCNKIVRICKDGWKKTGDDSLICSRCMIQIQSNTK